MTICEDWATTMNQIPKGKLIVLLDRMTPEARELMIGRFCEHRGPVLDNLCMLIDLRAKFARKCRYKSIA